MAISTWIEYQLHLHGLRNNVFDGISKDWEIYGSLYLFFLRMNTVSAFARVWQSDHRTFLIFGTL